jgi:energy-coupling factor transporter ATP-binding protein EcfA2
MNQQDNGTFPLPLFYVYAHEDEALRDELEKHLSLLQRQGLLSTWSDRQIVPGTDWSKEIDVRLDSAALILLLISSDFLASDYCYGIEMQRALARHERGEAHVIPIMLRSIDWQDAPFAHLQGLPRDMKPVTSWPNQDEAFLDIARGIRWTIERLRGLPEHGSSTSSSQWKRSPPPQDLKLPTAPVSQQDHQDRQLFLVSLSTRYRDILEQSLQGVALLALGLQTKPEAVAPPTRSVFRHLQQTEQAFPLGTELLHVYEQAGGELLLLGEPGAGKSTLLVHLAQKLLVHAQQDERQLVPVILNLSSWAEKRRPLVEWLIEDLQVSYQVPRKVGQRWINTGQILPLLDGLDEVVPSARGPCIEAINAYRLDYLVPLVVCSRTADYLMQRRRLLLPRAIVVQPLTNEQIDTYLLTAGPELTAVHTILQENLALRELAASPLMLNLLVLSYQGVPQEALPATGSLEEQQRILFAHYLKRMLFDTDVPRQTPPARLLSGLIWLARHMRQQNRATFYLEQLQPGILSNQGMQRAYSWLAIRLPALLLALFICIAVITPFSGQDLLVSLLSFSPLALLGSLFNEPSLISDQSQPTRKKSFILSHWKRIFHLLVLLGCVLLVLWSYGVFAALLAALLGGLGIWLSYRFPLPEAQKRPSLMKGVHLPGIAVIYGLLGLLCGLLIVLIGYLDIADAVTVNLRVLLLNGLLLGISYGLIFAIGIFLLHSFLREEPRKPDLPQQGSSMKNLIQQLTQSRENNRRVSMLLRGLLRLYIGLDYFSEIRRTATTYSKLRYALVAAQRAVQ